MESGKHSVMIRADLPNGDQAILELSARNFQTIAEAFQVWIAQDNAKLN